MIGTNVIQFAPTLHPPLPRREWSRVTHDLQARTIGFGLARSVVAVSSRSGGMVKRLRLTHRRCALLRTQPESRMR